jgi:hypothetical protein
MGNNPYPSAATLRYERQADRLLAEQAKATSEFCVIVRHALAGISQLYFPLGSPASGFDVDEITDTLFDVLIPRTSQDLDDAAADLAREMEGA